MVKEDAIPMKFVRSILYQFEHKAEKKLLQGDKQTYEYYINKAIALRQLIVEWTVADK